MKAYVDGYKPLRNYQDLLREVVEERLGGATELAQSAEAAVESPLVKPPNVSDLLAILVPPPKPDPTQIERKGPFLRRPSTSKDYLAAEARNTLLGLEGEKLVLQFEEQRLRRAGKKHLANRIEHVSISKGDTLGFDIKSFEETGKERFIEVKTTRFGAMTPFFATRNEVNTSDTLSAQYHLYRLFTFTKTPKLFTLAGSLHQTCALDPVQYTAVPN